MIERFFIPGYNIQREVETGEVDELGGVIKEWQDHLTVDGKLFALQGDEKLSADKQTYFARYGFRCAIADIVETDRLVDPEENEYDIRQSVPRKRVDGTGHMEIVVELRR